MNFRTLESSQAFSFFTLGGNKCLRIINRLTFVFNATLASGWGKDYVLRNYNNLSEIAQGLDNGAPICINTGFYRSVPEARIFR